MYGDSSIIQRTKEHCLVGVKVQPLKREDIVVDPPREGDVRKDQIDYEMYIIVLVQRIKLDRWMWAANWIKLDPQRRNDKKNNSPHYTLSIILKL